MQLSTIIVAAVAAMASVASAAPSAVKVMPLESKIMGMQYRHDITFASADDHVLERRGGGGSTSSTTTTPSTTSTSSTATGSGTLPAHTTPSGGLTYYGGPVVNNVEVTILTWGGQPNYLSNLQAFYGGVTNSKWFDILRQYWTTSSNTIGSGSYKTTVALDSSISGFPTQKSLQDTDIQTFLKSAVQQGKIAPNKNSYFPIHFPAGYSITMQNQGSCSAFCAYHGTIDISSLNVGTQYLFYGVIPDQGGSCAGGCGSNSQTVNNLFSVASHELAEMVTDPAVGVATANAAPLAWYNANNGEIGDLCNAQQGTTVGGDGVTYVIQKQYSNLDAGCVASSAKSP